MKFDKGRAERVLRDQKRGQRNTGRTTAVVYNVLRMIGTYPGIDWLYPVNRQSMVRRALKSFEQIQAQAFPELTQDFAVHGRTTTTLFFVGGNLRRA